MISEKISCRLISRGKKHTNKFLGKKYPALKQLSLMKYNAEKKSYTVMSGKKFITSDRFGKNSYPN